MSDQRFDQRFKLHLEGSQRVKAMQFIWDYLVSLGKPIVIVETGCVRLEDNWSGDGQSTRLWDWMVSELGGMLTSIDIDPRAIDTAIRLAPHCHGIVGDSLEVLQDLRNKKHIDLLFLDSMDLDGTLKPATHHLLELSKCWDELKPGAIIAVDDCQGTEEIKRGKQQEIYRVLQASGIDPLHESYVTVWKKPTVAPTWNQMMDKAKREQDRATLKRDMELRG